MSESPYLIAYDVSDPRRLDRVLRAVRGVAHAGQRSFYECWLSPAERDRRLALVASLIDPREDRVLAVRLDPRAESHALGIGEISDNPDVIVFE
jgi:CRISPR-associated protein Cas2